MMPLDRAGAAAALKKLGPCEKLREEHSPGEGI